MPQFIHGGSAIAVIPFRVIGKMVGIIKQEADNNGGE